MIDELHAKIPKDLLAEFPSHLSKFWVVFGFYVGLPGIILFLIALFWLAFQHEFAFSEKKSLKELNVIYPQASSELSSDGGPFVEYRDRFGQFDELLEGHEYER